MANPEHLKLLLSGKEAVDDWRKKFCNTVKTEFDGLCLRNASLEGINLSDYDLTGADLRNAKLSKAKLTLTKLYKANLMNADLSEATFSETYCLGANFWRANLCNIIAWDADFSSADMREACLISSRLEKVSFEETDLEWANLIGAYLKETIFLNTKLANAKLSGIVFHNTFIENWNISNVKCYYFYTFDKEKARKGFREERRGKQSKIEKEAKEGKLKFSALVVEAKPEWYPRIPEKGYLKTGEFEDRFKSRPTIEYMFRNGMSALDPAILGVAIDQANLERPEAGLRLLDISARGGIPKAIIEVAERVSKEDALVLVGACYQQKFEQMRKEIEGLKDDKESLFQITSQKMLLPALGSKNAYMSYTELAELYRVDPEALRKRLDRRRAKYPLDTELFVESENKGVRKPSYLYNTKMVAPIVESLKKKRPSNVRQKKSRKF